MLRVRASLRTEHQRHRHRCCHPGPCTHEQGKGQERVKGNREMSAGKRVTVIFLFLCLSEGKCSFTLGIQSKIK